VVDIGRLSDKKRLEVGEKPEAGKALESTPVK
jgi:hypothetical protein